VANHTGSVGGLERSQLEICTGLAARGHHVSLLYMKEGDLLPFWRSAGVDVRPIKATLPLRASPLGSGVGLVAALFSGMCARPDVIYTHRYWDVPFGAALGALLRSPLVAHLHLPPPHNCTCSVNPAPRVSAGRGGSGLRGGQFGGNGAVSWRRKLRTRG